MTPAERIAEHVGTLCDGWGERIVYHVLIAGQAEARVKAMRQQALIDQLEAVVVLTRTGDGAPSSNKPGSRPPGTLEPGAILEKLAVLAGGRMCLRTRLRQLAESAPLMEDDEARNIAYEMGHLIRRARIHLGYDERPGMLADVVCGECGGALKTVREGSDIRIWCAGTPENDPCGSKYRLSEWLHLLDPSLA